MAKVRPEVIGCQLVRIYELAKDDSNASRMLIDTLLVIIRALERDSGLRVHVDYQRTRDKRIDGPDDSWTCEPVPPSGDDWHIFDDSSDRSTMWRRFRLMKPFGARNDAA